MTQRRENPSGDALFAALTYKWDAAKIGSFARASIYFTLVVFISLPAMLWWKPH